MEINIITGAVALVIGFLLGLLYRQMISGSSETETKTQGELSNLKESFSNYQSRVNLHVAKTADLLSGIQGGFEELREHIFATSNALNRDDRTQTLHENAHFTKPPTIDNASETVNNTPSQPKDYA